MINRFLLKILRVLICHLDRKTITNFGRLNPFYENLFDWKERGEIWTGKNNVTIYNSTTLVGDVKIGENTWIGPFCSLDGSGGLTIGKNCSISAAVHIQTHDTVKWAISGGKEPYEYGSVNIGDNCFIGVGAIILRGVSVGSGSVVGAGAVVTKSFPQNSKVIGVPAREMNQKN